MEGKGARVRFFLRTAAAGLVLVAVSAFAQDPASVMHGYANETRDKVFGVLFALTPVFAAIILWRYFKRAK